MKKLVCLLLVVCLFASIGTGAMAAGFSAKLAPLAEASFAAKAASGVTAANTTCAEKVKRIWLGNGQETYDKLKTEGVDFRFDELGGMPWEEVFAVHSDVDLRIAHVSYVWLVSDAYVGDDPIGVCNSIPQLLDTLKSKYNDPGYFLGYTVELYAIAVFPDNSTLSTPTYSFNIVNYAHEMRSHFEYIRKLEKNVWTDEYCYADSILLGLVTEMFDKLPRWREVYPEIAEECDDLFKRLAKKYKGDEEMMKLIHRYVIPTQNNNAANGSLTSFRHVAR